MESEHKQVKYFYAKCNHPLDMSEKAREVFDYTDYTLCPQDYYAVYITLDNDENEVIVMEYIEENDDGYFKNIEDEAEFQKVCEYIESLDDEEEE